MSKSLNLAVRRQNYLDAVNAMVPDMVKAHAADAFPQASTEEYETFLTAYMNNFSQAMEQTLTTENLDILEKELRRGKIKTALNHDIKARVHTLVLHQRLAEPLRELCEKAGIPMPELRASDFISRGRKTVDNWKTPMTVVYFSDGSHTLTVRPDFARTFTNDKLLGMGAHEIAHIINGDLQKIPNVKGMVISHQAELLADATAARLTKNPKALASALYKIPGYFYEKAAERHSGWLKTISPNAYEDYVTWLKQSPLLRKIQDHLTKWKSILRHGDAYPLLEERIGQLEKIGAELAVKAEAWHPADSCTKSWIQEFEKTVLKGIERTRF